jgi:hypothetical protein
MRKKWLTSERKTRSCEKPSAKQLACILRFLVKAGWCATIPPDRYPEHRDAFILVFKLGALLLLVFMMRLRRVRQWYFLKIAV